MADSKIEWTNRVWNVLAGCSKISPGCKNCYAIKEAQRLSYNPNEKIQFKYKGTVTGDGKNWSGVIHFDDKALLLPLQWKKPQKIFVNSMSDLFHESVPDEWIDKIFAVMALCPQHTFQILTKRPRRMYEYLTSMDIVAPACYSTAKSRVARIAEHIARSRGEKVDSPYWDLFLEDFPPKNVLLGVSVENQEQANIRIPLLYLAPAAVRFLSCEPLLGAIDLNEWLYPRPIRRCINCSEKKACDFHSRRIDWVIAGGESGHGARPCHPDWLRSLRDQCEAAGVAFFFKQWGNWMPYQPHVDHLWRDGAGNDHDGHWLQILDPETGDTSKGWDGGEWTIHEGLSPAAFKRVGKKAAGRLLDGREWNQFPEVQA